MQTNNLQLPVNEDKVIDRVIDVYLCMCDDLNTAEVALLGQRLADLANRRATDIELSYKGRYGQQQPVSTEDYDLENSIWNKSE